MAFNDFERSFPFDELTLTNVAVIEYENGVEQRRDLWGRTKKQFNIEFKVKTKTEAEAIRDFFVTQDGPLTTFSFTNPIDSTAYTVRFVENSFLIEREYYNIYNCRCSLVEVF